MKNIDNLYRGVTDSIGMEYFKTPNTKNTLINPKLAYGYISGEQFLPLNEESPPTLCYRDKPRKGPILEDGGPEFRSFKWVPGRGNYVNRRTICYVTDNLSVNRV